MKITIDEDLFNKKGFSLAEVLMFLLVKTGENIPKLYQSMLDKHLLVENQTLLKKETLVTASHDAIIMETLIDSENSNINNDAKLEKLAKDLIELYPKGLKEGTNTPWRSNIKDIVQRLKKFFKFYDQYTYDDVLNATKLYVSRYANNKSYMRVLKYFIWKDTSKTGGNVESDLASFIDSGEDMLQSEEDWINTLR